MKLHIAKGWQTYNPKQFLSEDRYWDWRNRNILIPYKEGLFIITIDHVATTNPILKIHPDTLAEPVDKPATMAEILKTYPTISNYGDPALYIWAEEEEDDD